ncbi:TetR/AcrR family transcriptional regulator [Nonomuraea sp. NPDC050783]|uniref:TetR/AcrR family transcriptional regulator n=1 Tax=Nonomuraea sp. NPDC050783 TaxID=3154634 RepID=UPI00346662B6
MPTTRPGDERRRAILQRALNVATLDGLEGITLGKLATELGMSKSGVQGLFGTKQDLQLEIVAAATHVFQERVLGVAERADDGLPRLRALADAWIDYLDTFEGGCFFCAVAPEFDDRDGPVRDAIAEVAHTSDRILRKQIRLAQRLGELADDVDADQLIFEIHAAVLQANYARRLLNRPDAYDRARRAIHDRLDRARPARR